MLGVGADVTVLLLKLGSTGVVDVIGQTVVDTGTTTVTVVGFEVSGQLVIVGGHCEMVSTVVE